MELLLTTNYLKTLQDVFIYLHPMKYKTIYPNDVYKLKTDKYGTIGEVQLINHYTCMLGQVDKRLELMSEARTGWRAELKQSSSRVFDTDTIQVCYLKFTKRIDHKFHDMVRKELSRLNIPFVSQPSMFK